MKPVMLIAPLVLGALLISVPASAQEGRMSALAPPRVQTISAPLTSEQAARLEALGKRIDAQVNDGFKGRDALKAAMQEDMKKVAKLRDPAALKAAAEAYQDRYSVQYREVLKQGGVDLVALAAQMKAIFPDEDFMVKNGTHLVAFRPPGKRSSSPPPAPPPPRASSRAVPANEFTTRGDLGRCGAITDSRVEPVNRGMTNWTWAAKVGGCGNTGTILHPFEVPAGMTGRVTFRADYGVEAFALSAGGFSNAGASTRLLVYRMNGQALAGAAEVSSASLRVSVVAPLYWMARDDDFANGEPGEATLPVAGAHQIQAVTTTRASSVTLLFGAANAESSIKNLNATIALTPQ